MALAVVTLGGAGVCPFGGLGQGRPPGDGKGHVLNAAMVHVWNG